MAYRFVAERHAEEAASSWARRERVAVAPHYHLADLAAVDARIEAHLDGLRLAGKKGDAALAELDAKDAGVWYVRAALALERKNALEVAKLLDQLPKRPALEAELRGALGWVSLERSAWAVRALLDAGAPAPLRRFGLAAYLAHRTDPGRPLEDALRGGHAGLRAVALEGAGLLGRAELLPELRGELDSPNGDVRWAAALGVALLDDEGAVDELWRHADPDSPRGRASLVLAVERSAPAAVAARLDAWLAEPDRRRAAVVGSGLLGTVDRLPCVVEALREPALARLAGEAFARITGLRIAGELAGEPPPDFASGPSDDPKDPKVALDPDAPLPWPRLEAVERASSAFRRAHAGAARLLQGRPVDAAACHEALRHGSQRLRADVALTRAALVPGAPLLDTTAPAQRQLGRA